MALSKHRCKNWLPFLLIVLVGVLAYWNSFDGVFVYDDIDSIRDNQHIRSLWPLSEAMSFPLGNTALTVAGRPLLSLSFALNHALFGPEPWGYHLVNLLIHLGAGLLLFGIVKRTMRGRGRRDEGGNLRPESGVSGRQEEGGPGSGVRSPAFEELRRGRQEEGGPFDRAQGGRATSLALAVALIWLVHPLQTESVTYIVQRAEGLMGMLFLLTLYASLRAFEVSGEREGGEHPTPNTEHPTSKGREEKSVVCGRSSVVWQTAAVLSCAIGMAVKQTMFTAPLLVLLYDGVFVSASIPAALSKRKRFYMALFATWLIVFSIIGLTWTESTIDFVNISPVRYLFTQPLVLLYYLRLAVWPSPLVLAYGWALEEQWYRIVFPGLAILGMLAVMFRGLWRREWYGFVVAWFFLILAPTSSISPTRQAISEHRMYLSLAAVSIFAVLSADYVIRKMIADSRRRVVLGKCLLVAIVIVLGVLTHGRNSDYHSDITLWQEDAGHRPRNPLVHLNWGNAVQASGRSLEAIPHYREALRLAPDYAEAHYNWGVALVAAGRTDEAIQHYQEAIRRQTDYAAAYNNMSHALLSLGRSREAVDSAREAVRINPEMADAHFNLGNALQALGSSEEAIGHYQQALRIRPDYAEARVGWGNVLLAMGRLHEAIERYREAIRVKPDYAKAQYHWGMALEALGHPQEAILHYREAIRIEPHLAEAHLNLGNAMLALGRPREAIGHYQQALQVRPGYVQARQNISIVIRRLENKGQGDKINSQH